MPSWLRGRTPLLEARQGAVTDPSTAAKDASTLTIVDWDDTLLCTSFLKSRGPLYTGAVAAAAALWLRQLEDLAHRLLSRALREGPVYIVTNASTGWVISSAKRYLPRLLPVLKKVKVLSASESFRDQFPGEVQCWKVFAFLKIAKLAGGEALRDLVVVGDSDLEMRAAEVVGKSYGALRIKAFKLAGLPSVEDLTRELSLVLNNFDVVLRADRNMTIHLECPRRRAQPEFDEDFDVSEPEPLTPPPPPSKHVISL